VGQPYWTQPTFVETYTVGSSSRVEAAATEWDLYVARRTARHSSRSARTKIRNLLPLDTDRRLNHCLADFPRLGLIEAF